MKSKLNLTVSVVFWALVLMLAYTVMAHAQTATSSSHAAKQTGGAKTNGTNSTVTGSGTPGQLTKWTGIGSTLGDSTVSEDKFGKIGIGTTTPTSKLTVAGTIETTTGVKFPDGSLQTTAASGIAAVTHDATLTGSGTPASPLSVVAVAADDPARNAIEFTLNDAIPSYTPPSGKRLVIEFVSGFGTINSGDKYVQISLDTTLGADTRSNFFIPTFLATSSGIDIYQISQPAHLYADIVELTAERASGNPGNMKITFQGYLVNRQ